MKNIEAKKLINRIQTNIINKGIEIDKIIADLKELRKFSIESSDPSLTKIIRLTS